MFEKRCNLEVIGRNLSGDSAIHERANNTQRISVMRDRKRKCFKPQHDRYLHPLATTDRPMCQQTGFYLLLRDLEIKRNINKLKTCKYTNKWKTEGRGVASIFQRGGYRGYSPDCHFDLHAHINLRQEPLKKWAFQQWILRRRYCHGVFAT